MLQATILLVRAPSTPRSQAIHTLIHDLIYVDNPVTFPMDKFCVPPPTGYSGLLPIANFPEVPLISKPYEDRSPIHSPYDYE